MHVPTRTSGRRIMIGRLMMSSPSKARLPKPSPTNCRPSCHRARRTPSRNVPPQTSLHSNSIAGPRTSFLNTGFSAISAQNLLAGIDLLNQALARDPSFFAAQCQLAYAHDTLYALGTDHTPARLALADKALRAASQLRPDAGETHLARANH